MKTKGRESDTSAWHLYAGVPRSSPSDVENVVLVDELVDKGVSFTLF